MLEATCRLSPVPQITWSHVEAITGHHLGLFRVRCPVCSDQRKPQNRRLRVFTLWRWEDEFATFDCNHCKIKGWVKPEQRGSSRPRGAVLRAFDPPRPSLAQPIMQDTERMAFAQFIVFSADSIEGTVAEAYLKGRRVTPGADLRFSEAAPFSYSGARTGPAMVAAIRDRQGSITGAQVTHLTPSGSKIRRTTFGRAGGGAVRLAEMAADGRLAVGEGVETCLAFSALYRLPCWAALSATGLDRFDPPPGIKQLVIAADNDTSGEGLRAARALADRAKSRCQVVISAPERVGDWADVLLEREAA